MVDTLVPVPGNSRTPAEPPRLLGRYDTREAALLARDRDIPEQLEAAAGRRIELTHLVLIRNELGPETSQLLACSVGQPVGWPADASKELAETRRWLAARRARP